MKRFLIGGVLALALLVGSSAPARANGGFGFGFGIGLNFSWSAWAGSPTGCCAAPIEFIIPLQPQNDYFPMRPVGGFGGH